MDSLTQQIFNGVIAFGAFCGVFILKMIFDRIADAKRTGQDAAAGVQAVLTSTKEAIEFAIDKRHEECRDIAIEAKTLAVRGLDKLNEHRLEIAQHYVSAERLEKLEAALFRKLDAIEAKLDGKADKQ